MYAASWRCYLTYLLPSINCTERFQELQWSSAPSPSSSGAGYGSSSALKSRGGGWASCASLGVHASSTRPCAQNGARFGAHGAQRPRVHRERRTGTQVPSLRTCTERPLYSSHVAGVRRAGGSRVSVNSNRMPRVRAVVSTRRTCADMAQLRRGARRRGRGRESRGVRAVVGARCAHLEGGHRNGPRGDRDGVARGIKGRHAPW